jgi:tRNA(fMet)-specific endonuclease VapC
MKVAKQLIMMIGNKCVVDTSVIIQVFRNSNNVADVLDTMQEVYVPVTVIGELKYGAYKAENTQKALTQLDAFLKNCKTLLTDATTADVYGNIKAALSKKGKDIWIAAISIQYEIPLFANDHHFKEIKNLQLL